MPNIRVKENEVFDTALRRFKRICEKAGIPAEMRRHEFYEKPKWRRKRKLAQAKKRLAKKLSREVSSPVRGLRSESKSAKSEDRKQR